VAVSPDQKAKFWHYREAGFTQAESARKAGFSVATAQRIEKKGWENEKGKDLQILRATEKLPDPIDHDDLCDEAKRALEDFSYFQRRYLGRISAPWQKEAAEALATLLETDNEEYVVINAPPGSGKSTAFVHDIPLWLICRNRGVRIMLGSATMSLAKKYLGRIKRSLERVEPERAKSDDLRKGVALDAEATISQDFGRFRPDDKEIWTNEALVVKQPAGQGAISEKEATVTAYGIDTSFIGGRYDAVFWDDLVDPRKMRTLEQKEALQDVYQDVCESRLEPGGLLVLQGQRISSDDLYRFALDMTAPGLEDDDEDKEDEDREEITPRFGEGRDGKKYHHLIFKAHYEEKCDGSAHKKSSPAYPDGCLLVPRRLPWNKIRTLMSNRGERFATIYQQQDVDPSEVLVPNAWVYGHGDFVGCIDHDRDRLEIPMGLDPSQCLSVATADPSPTNYWSVQWWIYDPQSERRYLIDLLRRKMDAPDFLDWDSAQGRFIGVMDDWQDASRILGFPITTWIVESNAAQRFMLQYDHVRRWRSLNDVDIIAHTTSRNKSDPQFGVETIAPHWRFGRVRIPGRGDGKVIGMRLVDEVTKYPHGRTDDCVMAEWFFEWNLPNLMVPTAHTIQAWRPSWVSRTA
jgi:transcriptional regulator with XRE-family HTH domain